MRKGKVKMEKNEMNSQEKGETEMKTGRKVLNKRKKEDNEEEKL